MNRDKNSILTLPKSSFSSRMIEIGQKWRPNSSKDPNLMIGVELPLSWPPDTVTGRKEVVRPEEEEMCFDEVYILNHYYYDHMHYALLR